MELVAKISLAGTLAEMPIGEKVAIPTTLFKENSIRNTAVRIGKEYGRKYKVSVTDYACNVTRVQ